MYTDQTGNFPQISIQGKRYMIVPAHIDSDSIWVEPMKNRTEGGMMLARRLALKRMHTVGIIPKRQVLDNGTSMAYRQEIIATGVTYQLVPHDDHRRNIAEKQSKHGKTTSFQYAAVSPHTSHCTYGAGSYHKQRNSCYYSGKQISTQKFRLSLTSTARITITRNPLFPSEWKP